MRRTTGSQNNEGLHSEGKNKEGRLADRAHARVSQPASQPSVNDQSETAAAGAQQVRSSCSDGLTEMHVEIVMALQDEGMGDAEANARAGAAIERCTSDHWHANGQRVRKRKDFALALARLLDLTEIDIARYANHPFVAPDPPANAPAPPVPHRDKPDALPFDQANSPAAQLRHALGRPAADPAPAAPTPATLSPHDRALLDAANRKLSAGGAGETGTARALGTPCFTPPGPTWSPTP